MEHTSPSLSRYGAWKVGVAFLLSLAKQGQSHGFCWEVEGVLPATRHHYPIWYFRLITLPVPVRRGWWWRLAACTVDLAADQAVHVERTASRLRSWLPTKLRARWQMAKFFCGVSSVTGCPLHTSPHQTATCPGEPHGPVPDKWPPAPCSFAFNLTMEGA